jgi:CBS domain containing-hemolysin-like protein
MMTSAMTIGDVLIKNIYTSVSQVTKLYLDTEFDSSTINLILKAGFSRIPVAYSSKNQVIVGVLLVKSLLSVERNG